MVVWGVGLGSRWCEGQQEGAFGTADGKKQNLGGGELKTRPCLDKPGRVCCPTVPSDEDRCGAPLMVCRGLVLLVEPSAAAEADGGKHQGGREAS